MEDDNFADDFNEHGALNRWWKPMCISAWSFFVIYEIAIEVNRYTARKPLCPYDDAHFSQWYWYTIVACFGGFLLIWTVLLWRINLTKSGNKSIPLYVALNIVSMGTIATGLAMKGWGGFCIDILNVASPAAIWGEWMACGPLLLFITLTITDKPDLSRMDWFFMATFFFCLLSGLFIIIPQNRSTGGFWLTVSCVTYIPVLYLPWYQDLTRYVVLPNDHEKMAIVSKRYAAQTNIAIWLTVVMPLFTVNYLAAFWKGIDEEQTVAIYQILSLLTKGLFAAGTMDVHMDLLIDAERELLEERRAHVARREFMKYIFNEVRTPLNSLSVGLDVLGMSDNLDDQERECLLTMKSASEFMSETLDDVLSMQKVEEGSLKLELTTMSLQQVITRIFATFKVVKEKKKLKIIHSISPEIPRRVMGDIHRLTHVISTLISNSVKIAPEGSVIKVAVVCDDSYRGPSPVASGKQKDDVNIAVISVIVQDEGPVIPIENRALIFNNAALTNSSSSSSGAAQFKGYGLGLAFCKMVVELHKGTIGISSEDGEGNTFKFTIPFEVAMSSDRSIYRAERAPVEEEVEKDHESRYAITTEERSFGIPPLMTIGARKRSPLDSCRREVLEVLIVDDFDSNRKMLQLLLNKMGVKNSTAVGGEAAMELVLENVDEFQLILIDDSMIVMDMREETKRLRAEGYSRMIIGISSTASGEGIQDYLEAGLDFVCTKPITLDTLEKILKHIEVNGCFSKSGCRLMETSDHMGLQWVMLETKSQH